MARYATKSFDGRKIPESRFKELEEIIRHSPYSYNLQPRKFLVVRDQETKEKLKKFAWGQPQITTCSHLIIMCADTDLESKVDLIEKNFYPRETQKKISLLI